LGDNRKRIRKAVGEKKQDAVAYYGKIQAAKRENRLFDVNVEFQLKSPVSIKRIPQSVPK
jgi:hypothetical protein